VLGLIIGFLLSLSCGPVPSIELRRCTGSGSGVMLARIVHPERVSDAVGVQRRHVHARRPCAR
jgi:hypothetical protein